MDFRGVGNMGEDVYEVHHETAFRDGGLRYHRMARCSPRSSARTLRARFESCGVIPRFAGP